MSRPNEWPRGLGEAIRRWIHTDWEQVRGLLVLLVVTVAVIWAVGMCFLEFPPFWRAVLTIAMLAVALWAASAEWRPLTVSLLALTGVVLVGFIALSVGRSELERRAAETALVQLKGTVVAVSEIEDLGSLGAAADPAQVFNAIRAACALAGTAGAAAPCPVDITPADAASARADRSVAALPVAMAVVRLRLAEFCEDNLARPEDAAEIASASTASRRRSQRWRPNSLIQPPRWTP